MYVHVHLAPCPTKEDLFEALPVKADSFNNQSHMEFLLLQNCLWVLLVSRFQLAPQLLINCLPL